VTTTDDHRVISSAHRFLFDQQQCEREPFVLVISGTSCDESNGQRPTQLARAFQRLGAKVLFAYFRWPGDPISPEFPLGDGLFAIPLDLLLGHTNLITEIASATSRLALVEFPYPPLFEVLCSVKTHGWALFYDVLDDWPAFHRSGEAPWFERWLIREADEVCAVSPRLVEQIRQRGARIARLLGNAARSDLSLDDSPVVAPRGELTIGYFGYLSAAWFDWELIHELAVLRPAWAFHIVGYGEPAGLRLPANVHLLGRQPSTTLGSIARSWDVGIVPFREGDVARSADPIKIYEYLALGLPVVTRAVSPPPGADRFVVCAESCVDFIAALESAHRLGDSASRRALARALTWESRAKAILSAADSSWSRLRNAAGGSELWR
jgi:glycosyltransferase involved in cell wall biosynthesis